MPVDRIARTFVPVSDQDVTIAFRTAPMGCTLSTDDDFGAGSRRVEVAWPGGVGFVASDQAAARARLGAARGSMSIRSSKKEAATPYASVFCARPRRRRVRRLAAVMGTPLGPAPGALPGRRNLPHAKVRHW
jgi:hypothetical protein